MGFRFEFDEQGFANHLTRKIEEVAKSAGEQKIREKLVESLGLLDAERIRIIPEGNLDSEMSFRLQVPDDLNERVKALGIKIKLEIR